jgi:hypothetical protein
VAIALLCLALSELCLFTQSDQIKCKIPISIDNPPPPPARLKEIEKIQDGNDARKFPANADALGTISACREVVARLQPHHVKAHQETTRP